MSYWPLHVHSGYNLVSLNNPTTHSVLQARTTNNQRPNKDFLGNGDIGILGEMKIRLTNYRARCCLGISLRFLEFLFFLYLDSYTCNTYVHFSNGKATLGVIRHNIQPCLCLHSLETRGHGNSHLVPGEYICIVSYHIHTARSLVFVTYCDWVEVACK